MLVFWVWGCIFDVGCLICLYFVDITHFIGMEPIRIPQVALESSKAVVVCVRRVNSISVADGVALQDMLVKSIMPPEFQKTILEEIDKKVDIGNRQ